MAYKSKRLVSRKSFVKGKYYEDVKAKYNTKRGRAIDRAKHSSSEKYENY